MIHPSLSHFLQHGQTALAKGPVALIFFEDDAEAHSTLTHALDLGFRSIICFASAQRTIPTDLGPRVHRVEVDMMAADVVTQTVNQVIAKAPGLWFYYGFNAEYLYYPFCETRSIGEATTFVTEERRDSILTFVIDAYAADLERNPTAVSRNDAMIDKAGYYALRRDDSTTGHPKERQLNFVGGLRWRFEEHIPADRRRIDRVSVFRAKPGLELRADHTFNDEEYNTYQCPWHHSMTASLVSFRMAKALKRNPGSTFDIKNFCWPKSEPCDWSSRQLLELGLMETGQWF